MKYLLAVAAFAVLAASPASAAKMKMSCAGDGPMKMNTMMGGMPYDQKRMMWDKTMAKMNMAMSKGDMRGCNRAMMGASKMM